jgi:hypothetical protein
MEQRDPGVGDQPVALNALNALAVDRVTWTNRFVSGSLNSVA